MPLNERKALRLDYLIRFCTVFCWMIAAAAIIGVVALLPVYVRVHYLAVQTESAASAMASSAERQNRVSMEKELASTATLLQVLDGDISLEKPSTVLERVVRERGSVKITNLSYELQGTSTVAVTMQGRAPTREDLLSFRDGLLETFPLSKIDLPFSELAKSKNFDFSLKLNYSLP